MNRVCMDMLMYLRIQGPSNEIKVASLHKYIRKGTSPYSRSLRNWKKMSTAVLLFLQSLEANCTMNFIPS